MISTSHLGNNGVTCLKLYPLSPDPLVNVPKLALLSTKYSCLDIFFCFFPP